MALCQRSERMRNILIFSCYNVKKLSDLAKSKTLRRLDLQYKAHKDEGEDDLFFNHLARFINNTRTLNKFTFCSYSCHQTRQSDSHACSLETDYVVGYPENHLLQRYKPKLNEKTVKNLFESFIINETLLEIDFDATSNPFLPFDRLISGWLKEKRFAKLWCESLKKYNQPIVAIENSVQFFQLLIQRNEEAARRARKIAWCDECYVSPVNKDTRYPLEEEPTKIQKPTFTSMIKQIGLFKVTEKTVPVNKRSSIEDRTITHNNRDFLSSRTQIAQEIAKAAIQGAINGLEANPGYFYALEGICEDANFAKNQREELSDLIVKVLKATRQPLEDFNEMQKEHLIRHLAAQLRYNILGLKNNNLLKAIVGVNEELQGKGASVIMLLKDAINNGMAGIHQQSQADYERQIIISNPFPSAPPLDDNTFGQGQKQPAFNPAYMPA